MPPNPLFLATAVEGALAAGRIHREFFRRGVAIEKKGPIDLVTEADRTAERRFRELIASRFPLHDVWGEEEAGADVGTSRWRWIIDPLDGTTNFAHGLALFSVSIALEIDGRIDVAVVFDPIAEELFTAERGEGARLNGQPIQVSKQTNLGDSLLCTGFPYSVREDAGQQVAVFGAFLGRTRAVRRLGSAALDLCYVAAGRLDGFWEYQLHSWDVAAGMLLVEEAGGEVSDYTGEPVELAKVQIVASNGHLHGSIRHVIEDVGSDPAGSRY